MEKNKVGGRFGGQGKGFGQGGRGGGGRGGGRFFQKPAVFKTPKTDPITGIELLDYRIGYNFANFNAEKLQKWQAALKKYVMSENFLPGMEDIFDNTRYEQRLAPPPEGEEQKDAEPQYVTVITPPSYPVIVEPRPPAAPPNGANDERLRQYANENANYLTLWKTYHLDQIKFVADKKKVMGLIHRHMTEASEQRVISYEGGRVARDTKDPLAYLKVVVASHSTTGKADPEEALYEAQQGYLQTRMREEEPLAPYTERFEGVVRTFTEAAQLADKVEQVPTPSQQARHYIKTLNSRFAQYKDAVQNGLVYYPGDVHEAVQGASEWSTTYTRKYDHGAGYHPRLNIFVSPRGRGGRGYSGRGRGYYGRGGRGNNYYSDQGAEPSKPEGASADSECYNCGATDHWAATCPKRGGRGGGRGRGGRGYLQNEGTQKMVETAVMEQAAGGGKSKN